MKTRMKVLLVSPFAGEYESNVPYAKRAMRDSISRGEAPFASHLLYPQVLDDRVPGYREVGLSCEHEWLPHAQAIVIYQDHGISKGMRRAINAGKRLGLFIVYRKIGKQ